MRALLLLLLVVLATPAFAQRGAGPIGSGSRANDRLIDDALVGLGLRPETPGLREAVNAAFVELLPGESYRQYRLNTTQARAIAWTAVLFAAEGGHTAEPLPPPTPACTGALEAVYELAAAVPADDYSLFLTREEKERARALAAEIRRNASSCGCLTLADASLEIDRLVAPANAQREFVVDQITRMRRLAAECD